MDRFTIWACYRYLVGHPANDFEVGYVHASSKAEAMRRAQLVCNTDDLHVWVA